MQIRFGQLRPLPEAGYKPYGDQQIIRRSGKHELGQKVVVDGLHKEASSTIEQFRMLMDRGGRGTPNNFVDLLDKLQVPLEERNEYYQTVHDTLYRAERLLEKYRTDPL